jgi:hypothetical protein
MGTLDENDAGFIWMMSVNGTHCPITKPRSFSSEWSSHKLGGKAGVNYEIGLLLRLPELVWAEGCTKPGLENDLMVFRRKLKLAIDSMRIPGRKFIADGIYGAEPDYVSIKNDFDPQELKHFKNGVSSRHENFNGLLKNYACLVTKKFHHGLDWHEICFRAVCSLVMFQIESGGASLLHPCPSLNDQQMETSF